jgi:hypothetical protein
MYYRLRLAKINQTVRHTEWSKQLAFFGNIYYSQTRAEKRCMSASLCNSLWLVWWVTGYFFLMNTWSTFLSDVSLPLCQLLYSHAKEVKQYLLCQIYGCMLQDFTYAKEECRVSNLVYGMVRNSDKRYATFSSGSG